MRTIGKMRRSQVLSNGPGAIIDFRGENGAPLSVVAAGLEAWDQLSFQSQAGLLNDQTITHIPLQKRLKVNGFRLPPVDKEVCGKTERDRLLPAYRFPNWHVCPKCYLLQHTRFWSSELERPELYCKACSSGFGKRAKKSYVVPVRFVVTCAAGHLQDFPWTIWPNHSQDCTRKHPLKLLGKGAGLKGLKVHCTGCRAERDLDGALSPGSLKHLKCSGNFAWLNSPAATCTHQPVAIQRGASNAYFPVLASALDVPPFGGTFKDMLENFWPDLIHMEDRGQLPDYVRKRIHPVWPDPKVTAEELTARILTLLQFLDDDTSDLRINEHMMLCADQPSDDEFKDFQIVPQPIPPSLEGLLDRIVSVERLREVRALKGFTRLNPADGDSSAQPAPISQAQLQPSGPQLNWLPAIEVRGEGIFLNFDGKTLEQWEAQPDVINRARKAHDAAERSWREHNESGREFPLTVSARFLLAHTTAHALIEQLSLDSGYSTASIRERLYVSCEPRGMCGLLLYTSAPDSDGTLGGLSRKGRTEGIVPALLKALRSLEWCSSDPLCSSGILTISEGSGSAACHSCCFLPETSCEHFNRHLDRAMLIGTPDMPEIGYFHALLRARG